MPSVMLSNANTTPEDVEARRTPSGIQSQPSIHQPDREVLREMISLCQESSIKNFLFTEDQIYLSHLSNPNLMDSAICATVSATRIASNPTSNPFLSNHLTGLFLFVPVFSVSTTHFGVGIHEYKSTPISSRNTEHSDIPLTSVCRFVKNDKCNILLFVIDVPELNLLRIECIRILSTTCSFRSSVILDRKAFRKIVDGHIFDMEHIIPRVSQLETSYQYRLCPICNASDGNCSCFIFPVQPRHPLDHAAIRNSMSMLMGTYNGMSNVSLYDHGTYKDFVSLESEIVVSENSNKEQIIRLTSRVAKKLTGGENLFHPLHPQSDTFKNENNPGYGKCTTSMGNVLIHNSAPINVKSKCSPGEDALGFLDIPSDPHLQILSKKGEGQNSSYSEDSVRRESFEGPMRLSNINTEDVHGLQLPIGSVGSPCLSKYLTGSEEDNVPYESKDNTEDGHSNNIPPSVSSGEAFTKKTGNTCQEVLTVQSKSVTNNTTRSDGDENDLCEMLKVELRKHRNRQSAKRSNLRKRAKFNRLKHEVMMCKERTAFLRQEELGLRRENMRLRKLASSSQGHLTRWRVETIDA